MKRSVTFGQLRMLSEFFSNLAVAWFAATFISYIVLSSEGIATGFVAGVTYGIISLIFSFGLAKEL